MTAPVTSQLPARTSWTIDASHTSAGFAVRHMMVAKTRGHFTGVTGAVELDERDVTKSSIDVSIDAATIDTRDAKRDAHLKSADFFDVEKFPKLTFKSTRIEQGKGGALLVTGDLTMHGVTKPVTLTVDGLTPPQKNPWGQIVRGVSATGKLNRKEFGLAWNAALETGGMLVGEEVELSIDAELNQK